MQVTMFLDSMKVMKLRASISIARGHEYSLDVEPFFFSSVSVLSSLDERQNLYTPSKHESAVGSA